jgi:hypothetical protein
MANSDGGQLRLAELVAAFSLGTDLGLGQPMEHVLRSWRIAARLGEQIGLDESERAALYYVALLAWVGCVADSYEVATWFGDEDSNAEIGAFDRDVLKPLTVAGAAVLVLDHTGNPAPGRSKGKRTGVAAPRGASSKGQKADFLLEFTAAGDGAFAVERGKKRGTHGRTPYVYRVLDRDDGTLELAGAPESTAEETLEDVFADGKWRTSTELAKDAGAAVGDRFAGQLRQAATAFNDVTYGEQPGTEPAFLVADRGPTVNPPAVALPCASRRSAAVRRG